MDIFEYYSFIRTFISVHNILHGWGGEQVPPNGPGGSRLLKGPVRRCRRFHAPIHRESNAPGPSRTLTGLIRNLDRSQKSGWNDRNELFPLHSLCLSVYWQDQGVFPVEWKESSMGCIFSLRMSLQPVCIASIFPLTKSGFFKFSKEKQHESRWLVDVAPLITH